MSGTITNRGSYLNDEWGVGASQALYHKDGNWFNELSRFPGALFDPLGFILFKTEDEYMNCPGLVHGAKLHVPNAISSLPGYIRRRDLKPMIPHATGPSRTMRRPHEISEGSIVTLTDGTTYTIGKDVSVGSPLGSALRGAIAGETVTAILPNGRTVKMTVASVK